MKILNGDLYNICKEAGLTTKTINGNAPFDAAGNRYQLHHIGQQNDSTLAILTQSEHMAGGNNTIWHELGGTSEIDRKTFNKIREMFWKDYAQLALQM